MSPDRVHRTRLYYAAVVALLLLPICYFFGGTVIRFATNQGLLVVEVDDQNVVIVVKQDGLVVQDKTTHREFGLKAVGGEIELYQKGSNLRLLTKKFTLTRGGKAYVTVTLQELAKAGQIKPRPNGNPVFSRNRVSPLWKPTPEQQHFLDAVAKLKPEQQVEAVRERLKLVNPGFDGKLRHKIEGAWVVELQFITDQVIDISPVRALPNLERFFCNGSDDGKKGRLVDLSPLQGMKLTVLGFDHTHVTDLSPLQGMPLTFLNCGVTNVSDLSPISVLPLEELTCSEAMARKNAPVLVEIKTLKTVNGRRWLNSGSEPVPFPSVQ